MCCCSPGVHPFRSAQSTAAIVVAVDGRRWGTGIVFLRYLSVAETGCSRSHSDKDDRGAAAEKLSERGNEIARKKIRVAVIQPDIAYLKL